MTKPILLAVDDNAQDMAIIQRELRKRYGEDYEVICEQSPEAALQQLETLHTAGAQVLILLAARDMAAMSGLDYLARAHNLYPHAKRVLLIPWGNRSETKPILREITLGQIDRFATKPSRSPDEPFHELITELLMEWQRQSYTRRTVATIVGDQWNARSAEMRDILERSGLPFEFLDRDSDRGRELLQQVACLDGPFPVLIRFDGKALTNPSNEDVAVVLGARHSREDGVFDLAIVGTGPAGLSAAVYGASEGLRTIVVERDTIGGQAGTSSLIRNYMGFPFGISGAALTNRALDQAWSFGAETSVVREAVDLQVDGHNRILVFSHGKPIVSRTIVLAMGASYERLGIPNLEALVGAGVFYGGGVTEAPALTGQHVFVVGAGNSAGQAAVHLAKYARQVTMVARGSSLAASMSDYLVKDIQAADNIDVRLHTKVVDGHGAARLETLVLQDTASGATETVPAAALFVLIGARPRTEWLPKAVLRDPRGFILTGQDLISKGDVQLQRPPLVLETSLPGVFAAGDVRSGSVKRVASAVGEGGVAIQSVHRYLAQVGQ